MQDNKRELFSKLDELKKEALALRTALNEADEQKESWFNKKEAHSSRIRQLISSIQSNKQKRDAATLHVREEKEKRKTVNDEIKKKISQIKELNTEKEEVVKKHNIKGDPSRIKEEIEALEFAIETSVMPFDKEKEAVKKVNSLKKRYKESEKISKVWDKMHGLSKEIDELKRQAEDSHNKVQNQAKESQSLHEEMIEMSKEIDALKIEEDNFFGKFIEFKKKFGEVNYQLKEKLHEINKVKEELDKSRKTSMQEKRSREGDILRSKEEEVEEKIKRGDKLTTEDILVIQGSSRSQEMSISRGKRRE